MKLTNLFLNASLVLFGSGNLVAADNVPHLWIDTPQYGTIEQTNVCNMTSDSLREHISTYSYSIFQTIYAQLPDNALDKFQPSLNEQEHLSDSMLEWDRLNADQKRQFLAEIDSLKIHWNQISEQTNGQSIADYCSPYSHFNMGT